MDRRRISCPPLLALLGCGLAFVALSGPGAGGETEARRPARRDAFATNGPFRVHYRHRGTGETLVLLHGLFGSADVWRGVAPLDELSEEWQVVEVDLRGHGGSSKPLSPSSYGRQMAGDVIAVLDALGVEKAHVLGYSYGGLVLGELLVSHPDRLSSAVLGGCSRQRPDHPEDLLWSGQLADALEAGKGADWLVEALGGGASDRDSAQRELIERRVASSDLEAMAAVLRATDSLVVPDSVLRENRVPILALVGEEDPSRREVLDMAEITSRMTVATIDGANHAGAPGTDLFWRHVRDFLRKHRGKPRFLSGDESS